MLRLLLLLAAVLHASRAFAPAPRRAPSTCNISVGGRCIHRRPLHMADGDAESGEEASSMSLEEKMKSWEASEEEIRAASLGGVVPGGGGGSRTDAFDVGLYIMFPIMVLSCLAFVFFPFLVQNIDVTSVGPPPTS